MEETDDKKEVTFTAPWVENMRHRPDPNRIDGRQIPSPGQFDQKPANQQSPPAQTDHGAAARAEYPPPSTNGEHSYYDVPILQKPLWKWQIASYFYLGGLSAGAYLLGRAADRAGGRKFGKLARVASAVALAAIAPCPGLLIWDLGDPKRFHHMLRVWKPSTPMNLGTWAISFYGAHAAFDVLRNAVSTRDLPVRERGSFQRLLNNGTLLMIHDAAGMPLALLVASYTGVLLSCTSNPLWCKNTWLAPLFAAGSVSTGAEAISLVMDCRSESAGQRTLQRVDTIAHIAELLLMRGFLEQAGEKARPLQTGNMKRCHDFSTAALIGAELLKHLPAPQKIQRSKRMLSMALGLAGGFALRWSMVFGGHDAAADPHLSRAVSSPPQPQ